MKCKVIMEYGEYYVVIPPNVKVTEWMNRCFGIKGDAILEETKLKCRKTPIQITYPIVINTPMGRMVQSQTKTEIWWYFDIPEHSILVNDTDNIELDLEEIEKLSDEKGIENENKNNV